MRVYLLRHGRTAYNDAQRYQGLRDIPLSQTGEAELRPAEEAPETVYVSPLSRARRTAELLLPHARQVPVEGFREMDFGAFEGRNYKEMEHDAAYRAWVDGGCEGPCPGGESRGEFCRRVREAFSALMDACLDRGEDWVVVVAHGGVQMAVLEAFALPRRPYFQWTAPCGGGFALETDDRLWRQEHTLRLTGELWYGKGGEQC